MFLFVNVTVFGVSISWILGFWKHNVLNALYVLCLSFLSGFHLSATVVPSQAGQSKGTYNVAAMFDRCRITSCSCTCGAGAKWCAHVVALCLFRIHNVSNKTIIDVITDWLYFMIQKGSMFTMIITDNLVSAYNYAIYKIRTFVSISVIQVTVSAKVEFWQLDYVWVFNIQSKRLPKDLKMLIAANKTFS